MRLRRLDEKAEIIILEHGEYVSFANCGLPYYIGGVITDREDLTLHTPQSFKARFNIDVRVLSEAVKVSPDTKTVIVKNLRDDDYTNLNVADLDFGEVSLSEDKSQLYTTFSTYHFSPFAVYAVREAQNPEIKVISTDVKFESNNLTWLWISIAAVVLVGASIIFVVIKKKNSEN